MKRTNNEPTKEKVQITNESLKIMNKIFKNKSFTSKENKKIKFNSKYKYNEIFSPISNKNYSYEKNKKPFPVFLKNHFVNNMCKIKINEENSKNNCKEDDENYQNVSNAKKYDMSNICFEEKINESEQEVNSNKKKAENLSEDQNVTQLNKNNGFPLYSNNKEMISNLLKQINDFRKDKDSIKEFINNLSQLIEQAPVVNEFNIRNILFTDKDFEIFDKLIPTKLLFLLNLSNVISIINLIWEKEKIDIKIFIESLNQLGIFFSYVSRKDQTKIKDYVLLTPLPLNLYNYLSTNGESGFLKKDLKNLAREFCNSNDKYQNDVGFCFEEINIINLTNSIDKSNYEINPKIMYYLKGCVVERLAELNIIQKLKEYENLNLKSNNSKKQYYGYNEIDLCLTMKNDVKLALNYNFDLISPKDGNKEVLLLKKDYMYFFECKNEVNDIIDNISRIEEINNRFLEAYNNISKVQTQNFVFKYKKVDFINLCNKNKENVKDIISYTKPDFKNQVLIYSSPQISINTIIKLTNNIQNLNIKIEKEGEETKKEMKKMKNENNELKDEMENMKNKNNELKDEMENMKNKNNELKDEMENMKNENNELKDEIKKLKNKNNELEDKIEKMNDKISLNGKFYIQQFYEKCLNTLEILTPISITQFIKSCHDNSKFNGEFINKYYKTTYDCFDSLSIAVSQKYSDELLYEKIKPFIGKFIIRKEDETKWLNIMELIQNKVNKKDKSSIYYNGLLELLFGIKFIKYKINMDHDIMTKNDQKTIDKINKLILFIEVFDININHYINKDSTDDLAKKFENKFQIAILYLCNTFANEDTLNSIIQLEKNPQEIIRKIISCQNFSNSKHYFP